MTDKPTPEQRRNAQDQERERQSESMGLKKRGLSMSEGEIITEQREGPEEKDMSKERKEAFARSRHYYDNGRNKERIEHE